MSNSNKISGVIITYNEERHIADCIKSLIPVVDEIIVVDSLSTDKTKELCLKHDVKFIENEFKGHIEQKNFAMEQATHNYVLSLDADERVSEDMARDILAIPELEKFDGYSFNRLNNYCGKWLKHSWYPDAKIRLWNKKKGKWGGTNPHDKVIVNGSVKKFKSDILHYAYGSVEEHMIQIIKFSKIAARAKYNKGKKARFFVHVVLSPFFKFFRKYVLNLGFLDGYYGFIYCRMAAYLNFLKYVNLWQLHKQNK